ncbi:unnamed protein product [Soboliphyme baturini]|uniref:Secreted protein n=1 Tax=Soboliphyme baturini TaxID=241478 RepID=A0A183IIX9_9BILA|nr:unnamed protein product [Soboliphyme baturini]
MQETTAGVGDGGPVPLMTQMLPVCCNVVRGRLQAGRLSHRCRPVSRIGCSKGSESDNRLTMSLSTDDNRTGDIKRRCGATERLC